MRHSRTSWYDYAASVAFATLLSLACPRAALRAQEVYKSVDADGHVVYSDRGATKNAPTTSVHVTEPDPVEVARLAKQQQILNAADKQRQKELVAENKNRATADRSQQQKCESARNQYYRYRDVARIWYKRDADGNRVFYTDEEADAVREQARRAMVSACGS